ncbi:MAG: MBL fold metallo-hydrolase [Promethearchaeota archaeon]
MFVRSEGKINENWYLIDAEMFGIKGNASIYIIENAGKRLMIDTTTPPLSARKILTKLKIMGLYPIHEIFLSHSHWDHVDAIKKNYFHGKGRKGRHFNFQRNIGRFEYLPEIHKQSHTCKKDKIYPNYFERRG